MDNQTIKSILIHISQQQHPKSGIGWFINPKIDLVFESHQKHWKQLQCNCNENKLSDKQSHSNTSTITY